MNEYIGQICPLCNMEISNIATLIVCDECGIAHHNNCWQRNDGCSTFACKMNGILKAGVSKVNGVEIKYGNIVPQIIPVSGVECVKCGAMLNDDQMFCTKCGTKKQTQQTATSPATSFCTQCGNRLSEGMMFCTNCGNKIV